MGTKTILTRVKRLHLLFHQGKIPKLSQHEVNPRLAKGSRENYLYFTLPPCINFQRSSPAMWVGALETFEDPKTNYLFYPERVIKVKRAKVKRDLLKHRLGLQPNKHTDIWIAISRALSRFFTSDPRKLLAQNSWDVVKIQKVLQVDKKKHFPYLSGPKMANYWLYILSHYTDAKFVNSQEISIIPDTHVLQATVKLGLTKDIPSPLIAANIWKELLAGSGLTPIELHPVLWNWSRNNFKPEV